MSLAGCKINLIDVNFHHQKSLDIFDKHSADKIWSKKDKEWKVSPLMPIMVKKKTIQNDPTTLHCAKINVCYDPTIVHS